MKKYKSQATKKKLAIRKIINDIKFEADVALMKNDFLKKNGKTNDKYFLLNCIEMRKNIYDLLEVLNHEIGMGGLKVTVTEVTQELTPEEQKFYLEQEKNN
tara:strand:- start:255 stop:557 length:303 start_codon:yes stop_codon:yes gene_type:complete